MASVAVGRAESADLRLSGSPVAVAPSRHLPLQRRRRHPRGRRQPQRHLRQRPRSPARSTLESGDRIQIGGVHCKFLHGLDVEAAYHDALLELATRDGLTGAYNRRFFEEELEREIERVARARPSALAGAARPRLLQAGQRRARARDRRPGAARAGRGRARLPRQRAGAGARRWRGVRVLVPRGRSRPRRRLLAERVRAAIADHRVRVSRSRRARSPARSASPSSTPSDASGLDLYRRADQALYRLEGRGPQPRHDSATPSESSRARSAARRRSGVALAQERLAATTEAEAARVDHRAHVGALAEAVEVALGHRAVGAVVGLVVAVVMEQSEVVAQLVDRDLEQARAGELGGRPRRRRPAGGASRPRRRRCCCPCRRT